MLQCISSRVERDEEMTEMREGDGGMDGLAAGGRNPTSLEQVKSRRSEALIRHSPEWDLRTINL